jgi:hypothetical protein
MSALLTSDFPPPSALAQELREASHVSDQWRGGPAALLRDLVRLGLPEHSLRAASALVLELDRPITERVDRLTS